MEAVEGAFGGDADCAPLHEVYRASPESMKGKYSPAECIGTQKHRIEGDPDLKHVSTSYTERSNLTMRIHNRRFTRVTKAFSQKFESHVHMAAIWTVWCNGVRIHRTLRVTPAMASGLTEGLPGNDFRKFFAEINECSALRCTMAAVQSKRHARYTKPVAL